MLHFHFRWRIFYVGRRVLVSLYNNLQWCRKMCGNLQLAQTMKDFDTLCCLKGHCEKNQGFIVWVKRLYENSRTSLSWKINTVVSDVSVDHLRVMNRFCHSYIWSKVLNINNMASEYAVSLQRRRNGHQFWKKWFNFRKKKNRKLISWKKELEYVLQKYDLACLF